MKKLNLEDEANKYSISQIDHKPFYSLTPAYIAGATSKYVKQDTKRQVILGQIDVLEKAIAILPFAINLHTKGVYEHMSEKIRKLKKQL